MTIANNANAKVIEQYQSHPKDLGSTEVQVAIISNRITDLTGHLKTHKKRSKLYPWAA